jgi:hypothetical protein
VLGHSAALEEAEDEMEEMAMEAEQEDERMRNQNTDDDQLFSFRCLEFGRSERVAAGGFRS